MDPNTALENLREAIKDLEEDNWEVKEFFEGLDNWISNGGFLPREWKRD